MSSAALDRRERPAAFAEAICHCSRHQLQDIRGPKITRRRYEADCFTVAAVLSESCVQRRQEKWHSLQAAYGGPEIDPIERLTNYSVA